MAAHVSFFFSKTDDADFRSMEDDLELQKKAAKYQLEDIENESNIVEVDKDFDLNQFLTDCFVDHMDHYSCGGDSAELDAEAGQNQYVNEEDFPVLAAGLEHTPGDYIEFLNARERFREQKQKSVELDCADTEVIVKGKKYKLTPVD